MAQVDSIPNISTQRGDAVIDLINLLDLGPIDYSTALDLQRSIHDEVASGARNSTLLLLEHHSIFTAGKRTEAHERPVNSPVIDVDRGGKITWHGPGQLVGYPIVKLRDPHELVGYVREIESSIIHSLAQFGIQGERVAGRSGVWIEGNRKIAAIGIRVAQGVTMHGFAINVNCSLNAYDEIIPCGITDSAVTSVAEELKRPITIADVLGVFETNMRQTLKELI